MIVESIDAGYGAVRVLDGVSLRVGAGETVALLGTNGNGKSTLMKCVMGMVRPSAGRIVAEIDGTGTTWWDEQLRILLIWASPLSPKGGASFPSFR